MINVSLEKIMPDFIILDKIENKVRLLIYSLFLFKLSLLFLYLIGDYQEFTDLVIKIIIRCILSNDIILSIISFYGIFFMGIKKKFKPLYTALLAGIIVFSFFTITASLVALVL
jgi:hypothetical protein